MWVAATGLLSGAFAAVAYYAGDLRLAAHTFILWIVLGAVVTSRLPRRQAVLRAVTLLIMAVLAFYLGRSVVYAVEYGEVLTPPFLLIGAWCAFAVVAGTVFGLVFRFIGDTGWSGSITTAAAIGLVLGDGTRRFDVDSPVPSIVLAGAAVAVLVWLGARSLRQTGIIAALAVPFTVLGFGVALLPDILERVILI